MSSRLPPPRNLGVVAIGGAVGAVARVAFAAWFPAAPGSLPWVTLLENLVGAFLLALVLTVLTERLALDPAVRLLLCTGMLGAFTTYSTLAVELDRLIAAGALAVAGTYVVLTLVGGLTAALAGLRVGQVLSRPRPQGGASRSELRWWRRGRRQGGGGW
ncbi:MAG: CrcB family protein [Nitriliruptor sp.]|nr:MAG: CrcB family protein [Nitriliruptor sp.]